MKQTEIIMGMPVTIEIVDGPRIANALARTFDFFRAVDERYSPYKPNSEVSQLNQGKPPKACSAEMQQILELCEATREETGGYFNIRRMGKIDPSGLVKGWAIHQAATQLLREGYRNFSVEAGGDFEVHGHNALGAPWRVGIRNPRNRHEIIKVLEVSDAGVATSGTAIRGQHIYNPFLPDATLTDILSITVIGPNIYDADRYATAAFAMERKGITYINELKGFEGYAVTANNTAVMTDNFERFTR